MTLVAGIFLGQRIEHGKLNQTCSSFIPTTYLKTNNNYGQLGVSRIAPWIAEELRIAQSIIPRCESRRTLSASEGGPFLPPWIAGSNRLPNNLRLTVAQLLLYLLLKHVTLCAPLSLYLYMNHRSYWTIWTFRV